MAQLSKAYQCKSSGKHFASSDISVVLLRFLEWDLGEIRELKFGVRVRVAQFSSDTKKTHVPVTLDGSFLDLQNLFRIKIIIRPDGWRAFWSFGSGTLGSEAPQLLEPVFKLKLGVASLLMLLLLIMIVGSSS
jgi:hypothetical protein